VRERTKSPGAREFVQVVEFTSNSTGRLHVYILEGPYPVDGTWVLSEAGDATRVALASSSSRRGRFRV
jgi:hypothetical protein